MKKLIALLLVLTMLLSLAACGKTAEPEAAVPETDAPAVEATEEVVTEPAGEEAPAQEADTTPPEEIVIDEAELEK